METFDELKYLMLEEYVNGRNSLIETSKILLLYKDRLEKDYKIIEDKISSSEESFIHLNSLAIKLYEKGILDSVTGLYSRAYLDDKLEILINEINLAFLMGNIDNFKDYNDIYGHFQGDEALKAIANCFKESLEKEIVFGESVLIARYGGEEFCAFIHNYRRGIRVLYEITEKIRKAIERMGIRKLPELEFADDGYKHRTITIASGIRKRNESLTLLRDEVDNLLIQKSKKGKNKVYLRT